MNKKNSYGFTFLELMVVMALGLILFACLMQVYLSGKTIENKQSRLANEESDIRFVSEVFASQIHMAGYAGCGKVSTIQLENHFAAHQSLPFALQWDNSLYGFSYADAPSYVHDKMLPETDAFVVQKADSDTTKLTRDVASGDSSIHVDVNPAKANNKVLLISDCDHADIFAAVDEQNPEIHISGKGKIHHDYVVHDSQVSRFTESTFFISDSGRVDARGSPINGLYVITNRGNKEELLSHVNDMQISYVVKGNYFTAHEVAAQKLWKDVKSILIKLKFVYEDGKAHDEAFFISRVTEA